MLNHEEPQAVRWVFTPALGEKARKIRVYLWVLEVRELTG
jgi:hypothetical protein